MRTIILHTGNRTTNITQALRDALAGRRVQDIEPSAVQKARLKRADKQLEIARAELKANPDERRAEIAYESALREYSAAERDVYEILRKRSKDRKTVIDTTAILAALRKGRSYADAVAFARRVRDGERLMETVTEGRATAKIYYNSEYEEFSVKLYVDGKWLGEGSTYYTNDKDDAISSAKDMVRRRADG